MTPVWLQRRRAQEPAATAARIDWLLHRHHCHDPIGGPLPRDLMENDFTMEPEHAPGQRVITIHPREAEHG